MYETIESSFSDTTTTKTSRLSKEELRLVRESLLSVLNVIAVTVNVGQQAFGAMNDNSSLIENVIRHSQNDISQNVTSLPEELCVTTESLLSSLPNSNYSIALSPDIKSFKPFVDFDSSASVLNAATLDEKLRIWFDSSLNKLDSVATSWFSRLGSVKEVWEIRAFIQSWLTQKSMLNMDNIDMMSRFMDELSAARTETIWRLALRNLLSTFTEHLRERLEEIHKGTSNDLGISYHTSKLFGSFLIQCLQIPRLHISSYPHRLSHQWLKLL